MTVNFAGHLYNDAGAAVSGASVKLLDTGTTTQEGSTVTTDSNGVWAFTVSDQDRYDVEITSGSSVRRIRWDDQISLKEIDVRNNTGATTPAATFTNLQNAVSNQVAVFSGANSTRANSDEIYLSFKLADSAGNIDEFARMTVDATDVTTTEEDGQIRFSVLVDGTLTDVFTINSSESAGTTMTLDVSGDLTLDADGGDIFFKDGGTTFGSVTNTGGNLIIKSGTTTALTFAGANLTAAGTIGSGAITSTGAIQGTTITATTAFVPDASDGAALGTTALEFSDLYLADGAVIGLGDDQDVTLTHVVDTGILLSSTDQLQFGDSGTFIHQSADGVLTITSDTTVDINGAVALNGAITGATDITLSGELDAATLDISGAVDIAGTTNLDVVDIDGAVQLDAAFTVGVDDTGYDVKFFGAAASAYMLWDASVDDLVLAGAAGIDLAGDIDVDGTANLDAVDIDGAVQIDGTVTVGVDDTGKDVKFFGATSGSYWLWDESADGVVQIGTLTVGVDDTGHDVKFFGATSGAYLLWDESADKLLTAGNTFVDIVKDKLMIGSTAVTTTAAELNVLDAVTAGTVTASLGVVVDSNKDIGTFRNLTIDGVFTDGNYTFDTSGNVSGLGTVASGAITSSGIIKTDDATDATSTTDGSLQTDGGLSVVKDIVVGDDIKLLSDISRIHFGADSDVVLQHSNDVGLTLNSTNKLMFNDATQFVQGSSITVLSIGATDEIDLTATAVDLNGTLDVSGTLTVGSDGSGTDVIFYSATAGDNFTWDASAKLLTLTGTDGQYALTVADGNVGITDNLTVTGTIDANGVIDVAGATITGDLDPTADDTYDIGSGALAWRDLYLEGDITLTDEGEVNTLAGDLHLKPAADIIAVGNAGGRLRLSADSDTNPADAVGISWQENESNEAMTLYYNGSANSLILKSQNVDPIMTFPRVAGTVINHTGVMVGADANDNWLDDATHGSASTTMYIGNEAITTSSDSRVKEDIADTSIEAVELLDKMRIVDFTWNDVNDTSDYGKNYRGRYVGMVAQETIKHAPWIINDQGGGKDCPQCSIGNECDAHLPWHVEYQHLVPTLVKAIQELKKEISMLKGEV